MYHKRKSNNTPRAGGMTAYCLGLPVGEYEYQLFNETNNNMNKMWLSREDKEDDDDDEDDFGI